METRQDCIRTAAGMGLLEEEAACARRREFVQRRRAALNIVIHDRIQGFVDTVKAEGGDVVDALEALLTGSSRHFSGSGESASRLGSSLKALWGGSMANELDRAGLLPLLKRDRDFSDLVMREMTSPKSTGDKAARRAADIFSRWLEYMRQLLNECGADIGKLDGYAPQSHDSLKLRRAGETEWVRYMAERLDRKRTFPGLPEKEVLAALGEAYWNIVTGVRQNHGGKTRDGIPAPNGGEELVLYFKDAAGAVEYNRRFGSGNIMQGMIGRLETYARRLALMRTFGPNPEAMIKGFLDREIQAVRQAHGNPGRILDAWHGEKCGKLGCCYRALAGETGTPENITAARVSAAFRGLAGMVKLGGAFLPCFADIGIKCATARRAGEGWLEAWHTGLSLRFERFQGKEKQELGRQLGVYTQALLGGLYSMFDVNDALSGRTTRWMNAFFKMSDLTDWTEAHRAAYAFHLSNRLARFVEEGADGINGELTDSLRRNGLMDKLDLLEKMVDEVEGERYVIPENACRLTDAELERHLPERFQAAKDPRLLFAQGEESRYAAPAVPECQEPSEGVAGDSETGSRAEHHNHPQTRLLEHFFLEMLYGVEQGETPSRRRSSRNSLAALSSGGGVKPEGQNIGSGRQIFSIKKNALEDVRRDPGLLEFQAWEAARTAELARMRERLARDVMGYFAEETGYAVLEPGTGRGSVMYGGARIGTLAGEMLRFARQFKGFPVAYRQRIMSESRRWMAHADLARGMTGDIPGFIHVFVASAVLGYVSMAAGDMRKGREARGLGENSVDVTLAAIMRGGGFGLLGDFFLGMAARFDNQCTSSPRGPVPQILSHIGVMTGQLARGEFREDGEAAVRFIVDNLPFVNLWYTRMAMDYLVNYYVRERISPGTLRRSEKKMRKEFRRKYLTIRGIDLTPGNPVRMEGEFR